MLTITVLAADVEASVGEEGRLLSVLLGAAYLLAFLFIGVFAVAKLYIPSVPDAGSRRNRAMDAGQDRKQVPEQSEPGPGKQE